MFFEACALRAWHIHNKNGGVSVHHCPPHCHPLCHHPIILVVVVVLSLVVVVAGCGVVWKINFHWDGVHFYEGELPSLFRFCVNVDLCFHCKGLVELYRAEHES